MCGCELLLLRVPALPVACCFEFEPTGWPILVCSARVFAIAVSRSPFVVSTPNSVCLSLLISYATTIQAFSITVDERDRDGGGTPLTNIIEVQ